jgi:hypothetical protein
LTKRRRSSQPSQRLGAGPYEFVFNSGLLHCSNQATIASVEISAAPSGFVSLSPRSGNTRGLFIVTRDTAGAANDLDFHVQVTCS